MPLRAIRPTLPLRLGALLLAGTALTAIAQPAIAQVAIWDGSESGEWDEDGNWSTGEVPAGNSIVLINDGTVTNQPVLAAGDEFNILTINVGAVGGTAPVLTVNGMLGIGQGPNGGSLNIASADSNSVGTVVISGAGASIGFSPGATSTVTARVGATSGSNGTLRIANGGIGRFSTLAIAEGGPGAAGVGLVEVSGAGSLLEITSGAGGLRIGNLQPGGGVGTLRILDGAAFTTPGGVGTVLGRGSSIVVSGADAAGNGSRFIVPTQLQVSGASLLVEDGAEAQVTGLILEGSSTLQLLDGGTLASSGGNIGSSPSRPSNVSAVVSGAGARWTSTPTNGVLAIGNGTTGIGSLEVLDGGEVDFNSTLTLGLGSSLRVAGTDAAGVNARLSVGAANSINGDIIIEDGGVASFRSLGLSNTAGLTVTAGGLAVVETTSTFSIAQQAEVLISGAGAEIRSTGGLSLINNAIGTPTADFIIEDGARLELNGTVGAGVSFSNGTGERRNLIVRDGSELEIVNTGFGFLGSNGGLIVESGSQVITRGSWDVGQASAIRVTDGSLLEFGGAQASRFSPETTVLISGEGTIFNTNGALSITSSTQTATAEDFVIADGAVVNVNTVNLSSLGLGTERRLIVRDGATLNMTGGLQLDAGNLLVENATVNLGTGTLRVGTQFGGNTLTLLNSDFTAARISNDVRLDNFVNLGGTLTGQAGAVGIFDVGTYSLFAGDTFVLNHTATDYDIATIFQGSNGTIRQIAGDTIFSGNSNQFGGTTLISGGALQVDGTLGNGAHEMEVSGGARLSGTGTIGGTVTIADATIAAGNSPGTLAINGDLIFNAASILEFELGDPAGVAGTDSDLITVTGNLVLDGTLNIIDAGGFGSGLYRLISFGGDINDNGLAFGSIPGGFSVSDLSIQITSSSDGDVNLLVAAAAMPLNFWDGGNFTDNGVVDGGTGTWTVTATNWTSDTGTPNSVYDPSQMLIFMGDGGTVTLDDSAGDIVIEGGLQFAVDGYTLTGSDLVLNANRGIIRVGDGTNAGAGFTATIASAITGDQALEKTDLGTLVLTGSNSYTGGTIITHGTLVGDTTSLQGAIATNAALVFDQAAAGTFGGAISGTGTVTKRGAGRLVLSGANSYSGGTTIAAGTLAGNTASLQGDIVNNAALEFFQPVAGTFADDISGTGALVKTGLGTLTLAGTNSYSGGTSVNAGGLQGTSTSLQGDIVLASAQLFFDQDFAGTFAGRISGSGSLTKSGTGALTLTGNSDFGGSVIIEQGELIAALANLPATASLAIEEQASLRLVQDADATFGQTINGTGRLIKEGSGALTLTATAVGEFDFTGTTDLRAGALFLNGNALGGIINAAAGTRLGGSGSIGMVNLASGATIAPGNSIGTLGVTGANFAAGSRYIVELNDGGTQAGVNNDLITSSGNVTIVGGTVFVRPANGTDNGSTYTAGSTYTIITATGSGGVTGTFDAVEDAYAFLDFTLGYDATNVVLTSHLAATSFCATGMTGNQCAAGEGAFSLAGGSLFDALLQLSVAEAPQALDQLSGEIHASVSTAFIEDSRFPREAALGRLANADADAGAWAKGFGSWGQRDADGNAAQIERDIVGVMLGTDAALGESARVGVFGGYSRSTFDLAGRNSAGSADTYHLGAYAGGRFGGFGVSVGAAFAWHDVSASRAIAFTGFNDSAQGQYDGRTSQVFGEVGYRLGDESTYAEPFAAIAVVDFSGDAFAENGGAAALVVDEREEGSTFTTLGLRGHAQLGKDDDGPRLRGSLGWRRAHGNRLSNSVHNVTGSDDFTIAGVATARDVVAVEAGFDWAVSEQVVIGMDYNGVFGSAIGDHGIQARLTIRF